MNEEVSAPVASGTQEVGARFQALEAQLAQLSNLFQAGLKLETTGAEDRESVKVALQSLDAGTLFNEAVASQYVQAKQNQLTGQLEVIQLQNAVRGNIEMWETAAVAYTEFNFEAVPQEERKFVRLLAKELGKIDWSHKSVKCWITDLQEKFNESFVVSRTGRLAVVFNSCSKSTQERLLAANFGMDSTAEDYTFVHLIKTLGAIYSSVNHAVLAQQELGRGLKQDVQESIVTFLERVQETFQQAYGPAGCWTAHHRANLVEQVVTGVYNKRVSELVATYTIPTPFSFVSFRDVVVQYAQRIQHITPNKLEVNVVEGACFSCGKTGHIARECSQRQGGRMKREPPVCFRCNVSGHLAPKCKAREVYCTTCKSSRHVTAACFTRRAPKTTAATAGSRPDRINTAYQEVEGETGGSISHVSGRVTGSAFALANVSTSASGMNNFSKTVNVLVDTGNLLSIGLCVSEDFFVSLGGNVGDLSPPSFHTANGASENSAMYSVGETIVHIKCDNFSSILSGAAVVLKNLSQSVIVGMNFLQDNSLCLDLAPDYAHLIHSPTNERQVLIAQISEANIKCRNSRAQGKVHDNSRGGRDRAPLRGTTPELNQMDMIRTGLDNAPILMLRSAQHVIIPGRTAKSVKVQVPLNPAHYLHVYPVDEEAVHGATGGVYKFRTQDNNKHLMILYTNTGDENVTLTFNELIAEANMCTLSKKVKPNVNKINSMSTQLNPNRSNELWKKLKLEQNKFVASDSKLKSELFELIEEYQDVFASDTCTVGDTDWIQFKIDLNPDAQPVKQRVRPLPPLLKQV